MHMRYEVSVMLRFPLPPPPSMENPLLPCKPINPVPHLITPSKPSQPNPHHHHHKPPPPPSQLRFTGKLQEAIEHVSPMKPKAYLSLLQSCIDSDSIDYGRRLHASIASVQDPDPVVQTKLVSMYAKCGSLEEARQVFYGMRERSLFAWSAMINGCARAQHWEEVVDLFYRMMHEGEIPDAFMIPRIAQACANIEDVGTGRLLHSVAVRVGLLGSSKGMRVSNSVLAMYAKCGEFVEAQRFFEDMDMKDLVTWNSVISGYCRWGVNEEALRLFEQMRAGGIEPGVVTWNILVASYNRSGNPELAMELMKQMERSGIVPDVFTWTSMISGLAQTNKTCQALDLFREMQQCGVEPNDMTVAGGVSACASLKNMKNGRELHSFALKTGGTSNVLVANSLIDMYAKCGYLEDARRVFDMIGEKDGFAWNSMIGGYMQAGYCGKACDLFSNMENSGVRHNVVTWNLMISGYMQNGDVEHAMELFQKMEADRVRRSTASWNALIAGLLQNGHPNKALRVFRQMQVVSAKPNSVTILTILPACGNIVAAWKVKEIHACILHGALQLNTSIGNALIDTYSKSGDISSAQAIFSGLSSTDIVSWNALIAATVLHGCSQVSQDLFCQMKQREVKPDRVTFASMINVYSIANMVNEGKELFSSMIEEYLQSPGLEHYRGMVNLFGRSGRFREASDFIEKMPVEPDFSVWDTLFTAARIYGNIKLVNLAAENMVRIEPGNVITNKLHSLMYALDGKLVDTLKVRKPKKKNKVNNLHGCCWLEVQNRVHTFLTGEKPIEFSESKYSELIGSIGEIKVTMANLHEIDLDIEEEKEDIVGLHSEKIAITFALVKIPAFKRILIVKSIRMCKDCHAAAKFVSKVHRREILLKDPKCLHYFKDGKCSCRDYW